MGHTMALAAVFGPAPGKGRSDVLHVEIVFDRSSGVPPEKTSLYRSFIADIVSSSILVSRYPRCTLLISLRVIRDDGGVLAALANAAVSALVDAGVEMSCLPVASSFGRSDATPLLADPDFAEEASCATMTAVCTAAAPHHLLAFHAAGLLDDSSVAACFEAASIVAKTYAQIARLKTDDR